MGKIVVVGAGVTGLTTSLFLAEKGHDVTIIAKKFFFDGYEDPCYTSNFAGANWQSFAGPEEYEIQDYDRPGYLKFMRLAETEPKAGVWQKKNVRYIEKEAFKAKYNNDASKVELPWFKSLVKDFRIFSESELPEHVAYGYEFTGVVITVPIYLNYLLNKCIDLGVTYRRVTLDHIIEANKFHSSGLKPDVLVNCTGVLASKLGGVQDSKVHPIKGQLTVVENNIDALYGVDFFKSEYPDDLLYVMPRREGGAIIGGCMLAGNWGSEFDKEMGKRSLANAAKYLPQFLDPKFGNPPEFRIVREQVGFRPGRTGGPRIEIDSEIKNLVHNYGIGGAGYQSSYGTVAKTVALVEKVLSQPKL